MSIQWNFISKCASEKRMAYKSLSFKCYTKNYTQKGTFFIILGHDMAFSAICSVLKTKAFLSWFWMIYCLMESIFLMAGLLKTVTNNNEIQNSLPTAHTFLSSSWSKLQTIFEVHYVITQQVENNRFQQFSAEISDLWTVASTPTLPVLSQGSQWS